MYMVQAPFPNVRSGVPSFLGDRRHNHTIARPRAPPEAVGPHTRGDSESMTSTPNVTSGKKRSAARHPVIEFAGIVPDRTPRCCCRTSVPMWSSVQRPGQLPKPGKVGDALLRGGRSSRPISESSADRETVLAHRQG